MSVAIVAMVNHTAIKNNDEVLDIVDECGQYTNDSNVAERVSIKFYRSFFWRDYESSYVGA